jgi:hypothetical protein
LAYTDHLIEEAQGGCFVTLETIASDDGPESAAIADRAILIE